MTTQPNTSGQSLAQSRLDLERAIDQIQGGLNRVRQATALLGFFGDEEITEAETSRVIDTAVAQLEVALVALIAVTPSAPRPTAKPPVGDV